MINTKFLEELGSIKDKYQWLIANGSEIRGKRKDTKCDCCSQLFCPINAVTREKFNASYTNDTVELAAFKLGLTDKDIRIIVEAADRTYTDGRQELLETLGL